MRSFQRAFWGVFLLAFSGTVHAQQVPAPSPRQCWDEGRLVTVRADTNPRSFEVVHPRPKGLKRKSAVPGAQSFALPAGLAPRYASQGQYYAGRYEKGERSYGFYRSPDGQHWERFGRLKGKGPVQDFRLLGDGKLLLAGFLDPYVVDRRPSYFAIARIREDGEVALEEAVDLGFPAWQPVPGTQGWALRKPYGALESIGAWTRFIHAGDRVVAVDAWHGLFLVFNAERGRLERVCTLFRREVAELSPQDEFAVLGVQPYPDGSLLLASRSMDAVLFARRDDPTSEPRQTSNWRVENHAVHRRSLDVYPTVLWWEFRPESGTFHSVATPDGLPGRLLKPEILAGFRFLMDIDGNPRPSIRLVAPPKPEAGDAPGAQ